MSRLASFLPILQWAPQYRKAQGFNDSIAALIVTIMLIPQSLAYAMLAGLPPQVGLYASIAPLLAYAVFGTSRTLAVGPVAVVSLMSAAAVGQVATAGSAGYLAASITLAFLSGVFLLAMSLLRLGFFANFLSHPVISGFITASGVLIAASQVKHILGVKAEGETLPQILQSLAENLSNTNGITASIGITTVAFLFWVRRYLKPLLRRFGLGGRSADILVKTGPVLAIAASIAAVRGFDLAANGVKIVGDIPSGLPPFALPQFDLALWQSLSLPALLIALVGFVESVSVGQTLAAKRRQRIDPNQELGALGAANIASALSGGYAVTGGFARSVVNFDAGAETQMASVFTAFGLLIATLVLTPWFYFLPNAVLAATIIVAVLSLIDLPSLRRVWRYSKPDFAAMAVTIAAVLTIGVEVGIMSGVALSLALFLWRTSRPHVAVVGLVAGTQHFRNVERYSVITDPSLLSIRVDGSLYFANAKGLEDTIYDKIAQLPAVKNVVLMCSAVNAIDASALESIEAIAHRLGSAGVGFHLSEVKGPVMDRLKQSDFLDHFKGKIYLSQFEAAQDLSAAPQTHA